MPRTFQSIQPTILTIFGATGDLAANYLLPALENMEALGVLPDNFRIVAVGRRDFDTAGYLKFIGKKSRSLKLSFGKSAHRFSRRVTYYRGDMDDPESFSGLPRVLGGLESARHSCYNRLYYFATAPEFFPKIASILNSKNLLESCPAHNRETRVLVEKPFGGDLNSARKLNRTLLEFFSESGIYRIDHYQGKETVQNLMVVRFANSLFEPLWNRKYIDHIEVSVLYDDVIGERARFYDSTGALRDVVQNHALEMLALILMDEPAALIADQIRDKKAGVLRSLRPFSKTSIKSGVVAGQYAGYGREVGHKTRTETFVAFKTFADSPRWKGVPIYIRTGKALSKKITEISIHFKYPAKCLFRNCAENVLTFRIQPDESVHLRVNNKIPGAGVDLHQADWEFSYGSAYKERIPAAYERLLMDFIQGDQRLFMRSDEIEAAWKFVDSITKNWNKLPVYSYRPGTSGPRQADELMKKDGREWWTK